MEYRVGQILYFVGTESARVIPVRVVEEVVRTTIDGKEKTYTVELPDEKRTHVDMSKLSGKPFESVNDISTYMFKNAKDAIQTMIDSAVSLASEAFQVDVSKKETEAGQDANKKEGIEDNEESDIVRVDIGNGVMAKMNVGDLNKVGV